MIASEPRRVASTDGYPLAATVFWPARQEAAEQVVLICPAMGVRQTYYFEFAEFVAGRGVRVITFDYRGIGGSAPSRLRGFHGGLEDWGRRDMTAMIGEARRERPAARLSIVAHSVGGQILGLAANSGEVRDVLAFGAQSGYWGHWTGAWRWRVWLLWHVLIPVLTPVFGYFPASWFGLGRGIPREVARTWAYWGRHPDYVLGRIDAVGREGYRRFAGRIRGVTASDDTFAPESAVRALLGFYPAARSELCVLRPADLDLAAIGHFGYFRESIGRRLWPSEVDWLCEP
jgi:predicted alpha/beta hydrolase